KVEELEHVKGQAQSLASQLEDSEVLVVLLAGQTDAKYIATALDFRVDDRTKKVKVSHVGTTGGGGSTGAGDQNLLKFVRELERQDGVARNRLLVLLDCDVQSLPAGSERVVYKRI